MAKFPQKPEDIFNEFTEDAKKVFGDELQSIILYGSGARGDYRPGKSDLNFLIVLTAKGIDFIDGFMETCAKWRKRRVATPFFMTRSFIRSALASYPVEFLNITRNLVLVYGEDVLKDLDFDHQTLRNQCERELTGKLLLLRSAFLETKGEADRLRNLIRASITAFISIFRALIHLKGLDIPRQRREIVKAAADAYGIDAEIFLRCVDVKEGKVDLSTAEIKVVFDQYLKEVGKLWEIVHRTRL
ncbi:MAG TPA: nucleotidyltransferase domain-containing protein [Syntrophales bacterium]|nr:nucleotidyltransferase domain-containing protein [Syntrophales bacterium]HOX93941.1 nucleotidyltransferase domain-containing protein [Syntrophales bacterium]HPI56112.1 nucleotidyltransferase domain-containing protein [Syntrophales bacterium]HPN23998.1 nucleotidyltransferase domain-containing protein [Syntrophales bacterium]HQM28277.1 nucleotidyltransferase domain-containing protein [Syntrophales bacterium]